MDLSQDKLRAGDGDELYNPTTPVLRAFFQEMGFDIPKVASGHDSIKKILGK
jgi:hypothetical protein